MRTLLLWPAEREVGGRTSKLPSHLVGRWRHRISFHVGLICHWEEETRYLLDSLWELLVSKEQLSALKIQAQDPEARTWWDSWFICEENSNSGQECRFTNPDEHIIDALIFGSNSKRTQTKFLDKDATLTLDTALDIARTEEVTSNQIKEISPGTSTNVDALNCDPPIRPHYSFMWMLWHRARHFRAIFLSSLWFKVCCMWKRESLEESLSFIKVWQKGEE